MTEEDEVDILGDCSLDSFLNKNETLNIFSFNTSTGSDLLKCDDSILVSQNSDLLKCDYTIHPQWLLDKPSTNPACWYSNSTVEFTSDTSSQSDVPSTLSENLITDESGWTEKERNLLFRGIEIFGKSNARLSQFIGSKTPSEVKYYLKNFYSDVLSPNNVDVALSDFIQETVVSSQDSESMSNKELLDEAEIPASIEEVIAAVSTAKPTVCINKAKTSSWERRQSYFQKQKSKFGNKKSSLKQRKVKLKKDGGSKDRKEKNMNYKIRRKQKSESDSNNGFKSSVVEIVTGHGLSVPVCTGEQVIKIKKENDVSDSDVEIDIVDSEDETAENQPTTSNNSQKSNDIKEENSIDADTETKSEEVVSSSNEDSANPNCAEQKRLLDLTELCEDDVNFLKSMQFPKCEYKMDSEKITDLEKFIHYEFFEGRPTKTPIRYLKIRNHILNAWNNIKPAYVTKTSIRQGLKQCGDVNCIGRIHQFLEQIGAINFMCPQTSYIRPLYELVLTMNNAVKEKPKENENSLLPFKHDTYYRNRNKKKYIHDGEGGCTLQHNESGDIINTTVINEDPIVKKPYVKKPIVRLIYCKSFNEETIQEYKVEISLAVILLIDFHAHTSLSEVMGLVGGHWNDKTKILTITRYEPCKNVASSSTHCDMCPVTQAKATDILHGEGLDIIGWYHSHPSFAPEPSQQDIDTQLSVQQWIGYEKPCVGIILTPFSSHGALIASPFRCMVVKKKENFEDQFVPYKLKVDIYSSNICIDQLLIYARKIYNYSDSGSRSRVDFNKPYFQDVSISYLEKFISSVKMNLAKCSDITKMTCDAIIQGFTDLCNDQ
ncbi:swi/snf complex-related [Holotrichia oblita]|uniref:Swi/snf complex-related n=1 Tax=Holotrichia oblita TaxID=644536 RepID=A0ACB9T537_HOLOL|nr:swi/snf complex-related [Holotrichia oblita]